MDRTLAKHKDFFHNFRQIFCSRGNTILFPSDTIDYIYYLDKGYVQSYTMSEDGIQFTNLIYQAGEIFPYFWCSDSLTNEYYFDALVDCVIYKVPRKEVFEYITTNSEILLEWYKNLENINSRICNRMEQMVFGTAYNKVAQRLKFLGDRFGELVDDSNILIPFPLTHEDIANALGITRETASTQMKILENEGYLHHEKSYIVLNIEKFNNIGKVMPSDSK